MKDILLNKDIIYTFDNQMVMPMQEDFICGLVGLEPDIDKAFKWPPKLYDVLFICEEDCKIETK